MAVEPRIRIRGQVYRAMSLDELSPDDVFTFDTEAYDSGYKIQGEPLNFDHVQEIALRMAKLVEDAGEDAEEMVGSVSARDSMLMQATSVWMVLRRAGNPLTFKEAASIPSSEIEDIPAPEDHLGPTQAAASEPSPPTPLSLPGTRDEAVAGSLTA